MYTKYCIWIFFFLSVRIFIRNKIVCEYSSIFSNYFKNIFCPKSSSDQLQTLLVSCILSNSWIQFKQYFWKKIKILKNLMPRGRYNTWMYWFFFLFWAQWITHWYYNDVSFFSANNFSSSIISPIFVYNI